MATNQGDEINNLARGMENLNVNNQNELHIPIILLIPFIIKIQSLLRGYLVRKSLKFPKDKFTYEKLMELYNEFIRREKFNSKFNEDFGDNHKLLRNDNLLSEITENIAKFAFFKKYSIMPNWNIKPGDLGFCVFDEIIQKFEVKGFSSNGPSSFGPSENWSRILFVDLLDFKNKICKVYEVKLSNKDEKWQNLIWSGKSFDTENIPVLPSDDDLNNMTKKQLKELCKSRSITQNIPDKKGKKNVNKKNLTESLKTQEPGSKINKIKTYADYTNEGKRPHASFYKTILSQLGDHCKLIFEGHISELNNIN